MILEIKILTLNNQTVFMCTLVILTLNSVICETGLDKLVDTALEGRLATIPCVLKFHELYFQTNTSTPDAALIINVLPFGTMFQEKIMFGLGDYKKEYHNTSIIVRFSWRTREVHSAFRTLGKASKYVMVLNQTVDVEYTLFKWQSLETWNSNAPVLIILYRIVNSSHIDTRTSSIFTWYPYGNNSCAHRVDHIYLLDTCDNLQEYDESVGPKTNRVNHSDHVADKIPWNFHGCQLRASATIWEPYSFSYNSLVNSTLVDVWSGIEINILEIIRQKLNMTVQYIKNTESRSNRVFDKLYGLYSHLFNGEAQVLVGGLDMDTESSKYISSSTPYYSDDQTWCVARVQASIKWKNIFSIFTIELWMAIFCALITMTFTINIFLKIEQRNENISWAFLNALTISIGLMPTFRPKHTSTRFVYFLFLLYGIMINAAFNCFLISTLTRHRANNQVNTLNETIENDFVYAGDSQAISHYPVGDPLSDYIRQRYKLCSNIDTCLNELTTNSKLAVAVSRQHALNSRSIDKSNIFCFNRKNNVYSFSVTMLATYDFPLLPRIDYVIRLLNEGGLIIRWKNVNPFQEIKIANLFLPRASFQPESIDTSKADADMDQDDNNVASAESTAHKASSDHFVKLTIEHILGAIIILISGQFMAFVVFIFEYYTFNRVRKSDSDPSTQLYPFRN